MVWAWSALEPPWRSQNSTPLQHLDPASCAVTGSSSLNCEPNPDHPDHPGSLPRDVLPNPVVLGPHRPDLGEQGGQVGPLGPKLRVVSERGLALQHRLRQPDPAFQPVLGSAQPRLGRRRRKALDDAG